MARAVRLVNAQGQSKSFRSCAQASRELGLTSDYLGWLLHQHPLRRCYNGWRIYLADDDDKSVYDYTNRWVQSQSLAIARTNQIAGTLTNRAGKTYRFFSLMAMSRFLKLNDKYVSSWLKKYPRRRMLRGYRMQLADDDTNEQYDYQSYDVQTIVQLSDKWHTYMFASLVEAGQAIGLTDYQIQERWERRKQRCFINGYELKVIKRPY